MEISISYQVCVRWELREIIDNIFIWIFFIKGCEIVYKYRSSAASFGFSAGLYDLYGFPVLIIWPDLELIDEFIVFQHFDLVVGSFLSKSISYHSSILIKRTFLLNRRQIDFLWRLTS
jgi:hypothetical protein